jgi:hypothetical protein
MNMEEKKRMEESDKELDLLPGFLMINRLAI